MSAGRLRPSGSSGVSSASGHATSKEKVLYGAPPVLKRVDTKHVMARVRAAPSVLRVSLAEHPFLGRLSKKERAAVAAAMERKEVAAGDEIDADTFFVVETGSVEVGDSILRVGGSNGELALLGDGVEKETTVAGRAKEASIVWLLSASRFRDALASQSARDLDSARAALRSCRALRGLDGGAIARCAVAASEERPVGGVCVLERGVVSPGAVVVRKGWLEWGPKKVRFGVGSMFGEEGSLTESPCMGTLRVPEEAGVDDTVLLRLSGSDVMRLMASERKALEEYAAYKACRLTGSISEDQCRVLSRQASVRAYEPGSVILPKDQIPAFALVVRNGPIRQAPPLGPGSVIGVNEITEHRPLSTAIQAADEGCTVIAFPAQAFSAASTAAAAGGGGSRESREALGAEDAIRLEGGATLSALRRMSHGLDETMTKEDLEPIRTIGVGTFGRVRMVKDRRTGKYYALKALRKGRVIRLKQQRNVLFERAVLAALDHPFLIRLVAAFQDEETLYLVLELVLGGELFSLLDQNERLPEKPAEFYAACVVSGVTYLHSLRIVYRDVKPENLLLDAQGYIRICDFGFAKFLPVGERTYTLCGTPEYLAPECLRSAGHNEGADYWAIGILLYEMLFGFSPFSATEPDEDNMATFRRILRADRTLKFPKEVPIADSTASIIRGLLTPDLNERLGCGERGALDVKQHPFFADIDWSALEAKKHKAPWIPELKSNNDATFFQDYSDEEDEEGPGGAGAAGAEAEAEVVPPGADLSWCKDF